MVLVGSVLLFYSVSGYMRLNILSLADKIGIILHESTHHTANCLSSKFALTSKIRTNWTLQLSSNCKN
jgi:hypothetical protein